LGIVKFKFIRDEMIGDEQLKRTGISEEAHLLGEMERVVVMAVDKRQ
jgi:hypothetical protein